MFDNKQILQRRGPDISLNKHLIRKAFTMPQTEKQTKQVKEHETGSPFSHVTLRTLRTLRTEKTKNMSLSIL